MKITTDDTRIQVWYDEEDGTSSYEIKSRGASTDKARIDTDLLDFLVDLQYKVVDHIPEDYMQIYTRHKRGDDIFHGHPNYRGTGPWNDWVIVDWGAHGDLPCHISCFVVLKGLRSKGKGVVRHARTRLQDGVYAVVESALPEEAKSDTSCSDLFQPYLKNVGSLDEKGKVDGRIYELADTEAFLQPVAMIPDIGGPPNRYFRVSPRTDWHKPYIKWLDRPQHEDKMERSDDDDDDDEKKKRKRS